MKYAVVIAAIIPLAASCDRRAPTPLPEHNLPLPDKAPAPKEAAEEPNVQIVHKVARGNDEHLYVNGDRHHIFGVNMSPYCPPGSALGSNAARGTTKRSG